jgi:hypothetical protein
MGANSIIPANKQRNGGILKFIRNYRSVKPRATAPPNKACTGRWGFCGIFKHFSGFGFFLLPNRIHAHPSASNANR